MKTLLVLSLLLISRAAAEPLRFPMISAMPQPALASQGPEIRLPAPTLKPSLPSVSSPVVKPADTRTYAPATVVPATPVKPVKPEPVAPARR